MNRDLTVGNPSKVLLKFCIPLFASVIFEQLYNLADSFVVGKFVSESALAAVGNSYEITLIFIAIAFGCNIGCSVVVANLFGAGKYRELKTAVYTTFISSGALCAVLVIAGRLLSKKLLLLMQTPADILYPSEVYLNIYIYSLPFVFFYNVSTGIFSALGDSKTPFYFLMCSSLANIGMDILFVTALSGVFPLGVDGVAWATFICQGISCILAVLFVLKRLTVIQYEKAPLFSWRILGDISKIALPSMLQRSFISFGNIIIQSIVNSFGTAVIAGYSAAVKLNNLFTHSFLTFGNGVSNFAGQNIGAKKYERIGDGFKGGLKILMAIAFPTFILFFFFGKYIILLFLNSSSEEALITGVRFLRIVSPFYLIIAPKFVSDGVLRGAKKMKEFMTGTFADLFLRVLLEWLLSKTALESTGIWLSWPFGWLIAMLISISFYKRLKFDK